MRLFKQNKLWRDKIPEMMEKKYGSVIDYRYLDDAEFDKQIRIKLLEETKEVIVASNREELIKELADLYEVIDSLSSLHRITKDEIIKSQEEKRQECGGFAERKFVDVVQHPEGSEPEKYCLANPDRYPEIKSE